MEKEIPLFMWIKIFFNTQSIQRESDSSVLIKMPNNSQYKGWVFWHPKKLVREQGGKGYHSTFSFTEYWKFTVKLYGKGKYNWMDVIKEEIILADKMKEIWSIANKNVNNFVFLETEKIIENETPIYEITKHVPEKIQPKENNTIDRLKK